MRVVDLEFRSPKNVAEFAADPQPDWSFDALVSELNSLEKRLNAVSNVVSSFPKSQPRDKNGHTGGFVMHFSDSEVDTESDSEEEGGQDHGKSMVGRRYAFDEGTPSETDDFEEQQELGDHNTLMDATGYVEGSLCELFRDQQISVMEEIRSQMLELETELVDENEKFITKLVSAEKNAETKREMERSLAMHYQRNIAEALDNHLTTVQRNHEQISQIEEKRIRDDAIREEARRKEKALLEEKQRQGRIKAEAEMQARVKAEKEKAAQAAAEEAARKAAKEAAEKEALEQRKKTETAGALIKSTETALKLANLRLKTYTEVAERNDVLRSASNTDYQKHEQNIARIIRQISGSVENVRAKADALVKLINDPSCPQTVSIGMFTKKFVSCCEKPTGSFNRSVYAYGQVIVLVTSKVPLAMDILIAELNRVCIYTVPKHLLYSKTAYASTNAYYKALGYQGEEDGKIEDHDEFVERLSSCMKLYGALVQTEIPGAQNLHGITEGWAWLARFLNALPPNLYTAVALDSFLEMTGFTLYRKYKTQFKKMLHIIERDFLSGLSKLKDEARLAKRIANIRNYLDTKQFLKKPEGWQLEEVVESKNFNESNNPNESNHFNRPNQYNRSNHYY